MEADMLKPTGQMVLLKKEIAEEEVVRGKIVLLDDHATPVYQVLQVGPEVGLVKPGDKVLIAPYGKNLIHFGDNETVSLLPEWDIHAIVETTEDTVTDE